MSILNIRVLRHSAFYSPLILTIKAGFLRDEGLEPVYDIASKDKPVDAALVAGDIQIAQSAVATSFTALEKGEDNDLCHFAQINERDGFFLVRRKQKGEFTWQELEGRQLLADHFFQPLAMLKYALHMASVDYNQIDIQDAGDVEQIDAAFRAGQGDYVHLQGPYAQQLEHDGLGQVVAALGDMIGQVAFSSLLASRKWLSTDMAQAFMRAYRKGQRTALELSASEIARLEADFFPDIDFSVLTRTVNAYQKLGCWSYDPVISQEAWLRALDVFEFSGMLPRRFEYHEAICMPPDMNCSHG